MTTFDLPSIPAELMDDQPITAEDFEQATALIDVAGGPEPEDDTHRLGGMDLALFPPSVSRFAVTDERSAEWALRKVAEVRARWEEIGEQAAGWRDEINRWEEQQRKAPKSFEAFLRGHLEAYMRARVEADPKLRTVTLPSGKLKATAAKAKVGLADEPDRLAELVAWADANLEGEELAAVVQTVRKPMVSALAKIAEPSVEKLGERHHVTLACGHTLDMFWDTESEDTDLSFAAADMARCHACPESFGEAMLQAVTAVEVEPVEEPVVRDARTGHPIPGAVVVPPSMSFSVKVGG